MEKIVTDTMKDGPGLQPPATKVCNTCGEEKTFELFTKSRSSAFGRSNCCKACEAMKARQRREANRAEYNAAAVARYHLDPKKHNARSSAYAKANKDKIRGYQRDYVDRNREKVAENLRRWRAENRDKVVQYRIDRTDAERDARRKATEVTVVAPPEVLKALRAQKRKTWVAGWVERNRERVRAYGRAYKDRNLEQYRKRDREKKQKARQRRTEAGLPHHRTKFARKWRKPGWVSWGELFALRAQVKEATQATGVPHELDHIYPINSEYVCGLDTPNNLRVVTRTVNRSKNNKISSHCLHEFMDLPPEAVYWEGQDV